MANYQRKQRGVVSKLDMAGENVLKRAMELIMTKLSNQNIAKKLNEEFGLNLTRRNIYYFRKKVLPKTMKEAQEINPLPILRAKFLLDHNEIFVKDFFNLKEVQEGIEKDTTLNPCKRAMLIGRIIDKRGRMLMRYYRLTGRIR